MNQAAHAPELPYCRNCHYTLATPRPVYCGHCGQETDLHPPSLREMFTEYLGHYVAFDGPLWRTLWALVCLPGQLTDAYFHGQRRRYVLPLRVYLSASFLFFVGSHLLSHEEPEPEPDKAAVQQPAAADKAVRVKVRPDMSPASAAAMAEALSRGASAADADKPSLSARIEGCTQAQAANCARSERWLNRLIGRLESMTREQFMTRMRALAPYGMLAMQPVFAALLLAMFAGSGRRYAEHFVFSLHSHSLWFLALLVATVTDLEGLMSLAVFGHGLLAMRRVYGLGWFGAIWRGLLLSVGYFVLLGLVALGLMATIAMTA
ncbi:DUF3667 domain-containing protein [Pelomonas aquatica]|jgi:hypothetical protein|uniref:DUF3667 domain-containing protein n=1 Tax=Pelomonas aquatica TaxID=431058 RepID=A0A9X4LEI6_9BURK|nr:DUF3667 domain-containing protein [Pelomonas aquatica]MCY4753780.1 DUF3667 domain-containing protein [Pelomonas aquatica]MDG0861107.1 DUF3667 domain-containing protein [Pelomonas aquatica]